MAPALGKRLAVAGIIAFSALIVYVWQSQLLPDIDKLLPIVRAKPGAGPPVAVPPVVAHKKIRCPRGFGEGQSASFENKSSARPRQHQLVTAPKIIALVFFGRRATVSILDCYLKRNLATNGGLLDQVVWLQRTSNAEDLALLDRLLNSEPQYARQVVDDADAHDFASSYDAVVDANMYIKIDDDVVSRSQPIALPLPSPRFVPPAHAQQVFIEQDAIRSVVCTKLARPDYYVVSANVVNQPMISWIHWNLGAVRPYLPGAGEEYPAPEPGHQVDWRASALPSWNGSGGVDIDASSWNSPDGRKHRWLPVRGRPDHVLEKTPIVETQYDAFGTGLHRWQVAAQEHYSFFENLESRELWRYKFNTWDFQRLRMGIQFIAMMGHDINAAKPIGRDDEEHFSVTMPKKLGRNAVADGRGVVSHYSFGPQSRDGGLDTTDVLDRYRSYAKEKVCMGPMLWSP
ncbi:uncharacterized protein MAM_07733 [Metarhizium album ARSEF 1941]|uniref:Uncharacterized protein n=1 Tax=Metarhizium album (strain ARSEF 1941) TaxID=1081103 RepID=A0A0B2WLQ7_METAS|nr:uncharacterized protein MAM_07733 [Metarhizium album ARSEF 1941]KHN94417.1 hypothetical protein MAM_07733 [Metarhizium album ARSEF 1941]